MRTPTAVNEVGKSHRTKRKLVDLDPTGRESPYEVRYMLFGTLVGLISEAYNWLMPSVADELERYQDTAGAQAEVLNYDRSNFLKLMTLCMSFHRLQLELDEKEYRQQVESRGGGWSGCGRVRLS